MHQSTTPSLSQDYLTKMGIKAVRHLLYSPDLAPCEFWLFTKLRGCRYETIEEMKEAVTKVIDTLTQEDFCGVLQKLLERYNKCIAAGRDNLEGDKSFMGVLSIKVPIRKKVWKLILCTSYIYLYIYMQRLNTMVIIIRYEKGYPISNPVRGCEFRLGKRKECNYSPSS